MKKMASYVAMGLVGSYLLSLSVMIPYFNWKYAQENGFIKWVILGEIIASAKSIIWPYYIFYDKNGNKNKVQVDSIYGESSIQYINAKKSGDEAINIVLKKGDITALDKSDSIKMLELLRLSLSEARLVKKSYLMVVHNEFPDKYEKGYRLAVQTMIEGFESDNTALLLAGAYGYNEFVVWVKNHKDELRFP